MTRSGSTAPRWQRATAATILGVVALNALWAGYAFMRAPDGSAMGIPVAWLAASPFADYFVPGLILFALGVLYAFSAWREIARGREAWFWTGLSAGAMIVWILVQIAMMGFTRHPIQTTLQSVILLAGAVTGAIAYAQMRLARAGERASDA